MKLNQAGINLIRGFEGLRLDPYQDVAGKWTIGIGHLIQPNEHFSTITLQQAETMLRADLKQICDGVHTIVTIPINDNQFSALVCFAYNVGLGALESSTLLKKLNQGDIEGAELEFLRWTKAGGKIVNGLIKRREAEAALFAAPAPMQPFASV